MQPKQGALGGVLAVLTILAIVGAVMLSFYLGQSSMRQDSTVSTTASTTTATTTSTTKATTTTSTTTRSCNPCSPCGKNNRDVNLTSGTLYGGTESASESVPANRSAFFQFSLTNFGSNSSITGIIQTGPGITAISSWETSAGVSLGSGNNNLPCGKETSFTFYPYGNAQNITRGETFDYAIEISNGNSISGSLIAQ